MARRTVEHPFPLPHTKTTAPTMLHLPRHPPREPEVYPRVSLKVTRKNPSLPLLHLGKLLTCLIDVQANQAVLTGVIRCALVLSAPLQLRTPVAPATGRIITKLLRSRRQKCHQERCQSLLRLLRIISRREFSKETSTWISSRFRYAQHYTNGNSEHLTLLFDQLYTTAFALVMESTTLKVSV